MRIHVELCYNGRRDKEIYRLTLPTGAREYVSVPDGDGWTRKAATKALDILEHVYHYNRRGIRFQVR